MINEGHLMNYYLYTHASFTRYITIREAGHQGVDDDLVIETASAKCTRALRKVLGFRGHGQALR